MKLDKRQFCIAVETYQEMLEEEDKLINAFDISPEWKPGHWIQNYYELLEELCELEVDDLYGSDLDWFCFETNFGQKEDMNKVYDTETGRTWRIESPEILYDFITRDE
jgi:hypothetical protein